MNWFKDIFHHEKPVAEIHAPVQQAPEKAKRTVTCSVCGGKGHSARSCAKKVTAPAPAETE